MKFNVINDNTTGFAEGYCLAKFKGINKVQTKNGEKYKMVFNLCSMKAGVPVETEFSTGILCSSKENPGVLQESTVKDLCNAMGVAYSNVIELPLVGEDVGSFGKTCKVFMKRSVFDGRESLNMGWHEGHAIWPESVDAPIVNQHKGYGI